MSPRSWTIGSILVGLAVLSAGLGGGVGLVLLPPSIHLEQGPANPASQADLPSDWNRLDALGAYAVIHTRPLREELFPRDEPLAPVRLELLYTVIASDHRSALLRTEDGQTVEVLPGQSIQGATVTRIEDGTVVLQRNGRDILVTLPREGS